MAEKKPVQFVRLIEELVAHRVDFIVVGGVAAVIEGAPVSTFDLDVLVRFEPDNLERLVAALDDLDTTYVDPAGRVIRPAVERFGTDGQHLFRTRHGRLDVLSSIGNGSRYEDLIDHTNLRLVAGSNITVLELQETIRSKEEANRPKDRAVLEILRRTLAEQRRRSPSPVSGGNGSD